MQDQVKTEIVLETVMDPPLQSIDTLGSGPRNVYLTIVNLTVPQWGLVGSGNPQ